MAPTAKAETYWLFIAGRFAVTSANMIKIPTESLQQCDESGQKIVSHDVINDRIYENLDYVCVKGK